MDLRRDLSLARRALVGAGAPLHLTLYVTGRCPLRCRHCFHWREVAAGPPGPDAADVERLAASLGRFGPLLWVGFGGGEPLLRADLAELGASFGRRGLRHLAIPTSGVAPRTPERVGRLLDACPDTHVAVSVSIDGPPAVHDRLRGRGGTHARAVETLRALRALAGGRPNLGVGVIATLTRANQDVLAGHLADLVRAERPHNLTLNLARGDALDRSELDVDLDRYDELVATKARLAREGALPYFDFPLARLARARDRAMYAHVSRVARAGGDPGRGHLPCTAGTASCVVFEDGDVAACELRGERLGNLHDVGWDLGRLWASAAARDLRRAIRAERCACTWECAQGDNVLLRKRAWPRLAREVLRG